MKYLTFSDVMFKPRYSKVRSRSNVITEVLMVGGFTLQLPVISANMRDITGPKMVVAMTAAGGFGILHRFNNADDAVDEYRKTCARLVAHYNTLRAKSGIKQFPKTYKFRNAFGVSIGVKKADRQRFHRLWDAGARVFCIDVAHGHHILVKEMITWIRKDIQKMGAVTKGKNFMPPYIIAGNVATPEGAADLISWGADCVKVGIGPGEVCDTRKNTGAGVPQLSALQTIREANPDIIMIADGGIKSTGDIAKALKYANAVMVGNFISGTSETPGNVYQNPDEQFYKTYGGSASGERKVSNGQEHAFVEGRIKTVPFRGHVKYILRKIKENLQSSLSYSGVDNLYDFRKYAELIEISGGGQRESKI